MRDWFSEFLLIVLFMFLGFLVGLSVGVAIADAQCTTTTIVGPDGTVRTCSVCGNIVTCY
jgi:hypothetical protein